jgi:single-stranded-DNA-specific exonuclease
VPTRWVAATEPPAAAGLATALGDRRLAFLLAQRGVASAAQASAFLAPGLDQLHPAELLLGLPEAVTRLAEACRRGECVAVVGDYDVDGVSATALLSAVLRSAGARVETLLGRRHEEGYGLHATHARRARERGASVLVAVDCGTNSHAAAGEARALGLELVIVDHHLLEQGVPSQAILVNPRQPGDRYPFSELAAVGLALKVAVHLLERLERPVPWEALLRVACLGTIADVVPLVGENRVIAALGLSALPGTRSPGLRALIEEAGLRPPLRAEDLAFRLAPRLNAAGRLGSAEPALELLLSRDIARARTLAGELGRLNQERQQLEARILEQAREQIAGRGPSRLGVAWSPEWNRGVVGVAASRLVRELGHPVVLLAVDGDEATGSGRSVPGIHLHDFLRPWAGRLVRFGGHAQAVGLTLRRGELDTLSREWQDATEDWDAGALEPSLRYDLELAPVEADDPALLEQIERLAPFGAGNPEPLLRIGPLEPAGPVRRFGNGHGARPMTGPRRSAPIEAYGWGWGDRLAALDGPVEVLVHLERDLWRGGPRLRLADLRTAAPGASAP